MPDEVYIIFIIILIALAIYVNGTKAYIIIVLFILAILANFENKADYNKYFQITGGAEEEQSNMYQGIDLSAYEDNKIIKLDDNSANSEIIKSWFPQDAPNKNLFQVVKESIYSISRSDVSERLSQEILNIMYDTKATATLEEYGRKLIITDASANVGGNTLNFAKHFKHVNAVEINPVTCQALQNNIDVYKGFDKDYSIPSNVKVYCTSYIDIYNDLKQDIVFMDPPWGGIDYREQKNIMLKLGKLPVYAILNNMRRPPALAVIKCPRNFDFGRFKKYIKRHPRVWIVKYYGHNMIFVKYNLGFVKPR